MADAARNKMLSLGAVLPQLSPWPLLSLQGLQPACDGVPAGNAGGVADAARQDKDPTVTPTWSQTLFLGQALEQIGC